LSFGEKKVCAIKKKKVLECQGKKRFEDIKKKTDRKYRRKVMRPSKAEGGPYGQKFEPNYS